jgi:hypothetical protein
MLKTIRNVLSGILEGIIAAKSYRANKHIHEYLSTATDHADLKAKEEKLKSVGAL